MSDNFSAIYDIPYGSHQRQIVDIFIPDDAKSLSGVILFVHGGGWHSGDKTIHYKDVRHFSDQGYVCATMNYRYVSENISVFDELDDITSALKTVKQKCAEYGYNIEKLILSGGSAGAHLALLYAYTRKDEAPVTPVAVCAYCPPVDFSEPDFLREITGEFEDWKYDLLSKCCSMRVTKADFLNDQQQKALKNISPVQYVSESCIPTAVFYGKHDNLIPFEHIEDFISLLKAKEVKHDFLIYENSGHALDKDPDVSAQARNIIKSYAEMYL